MDDIGLLMKLDSVAIGISKSFEMDKNEGFDTHDSVKNCCAAIGRLTPKSKVIFNVFEDFQQFIATFYKVRKHFRKISNNIMMLDALKLKYADTIPNKNITVDLSTTHVAVVRVLESDCLITKKGFQHHAMGYEISASHCLSVKDW